MRNCNLLILANNQKYALGTKVFDYIYLNKPIIAFVEKKGEIEKLLQDFKNTYCYRNDFELYDKMHSFLATKNPKLYEGSEGEKYSRENQAEKLYKKINEIIE